jgi:uncharacterized repeat protein (TIGR03803 family)
MSLIQGSDGNFYGTTEVGGTGNPSCSVGCGSVFKLTPQGALTTLHSFNIADGEYPLASVTQATDGDFYGTADGGGDNSLGTVFKITSTGTLTTLHSFSGTDGEYPNGALIQGTDGAFYGTTSFGASADCPLGCGTVFKITRNGTLTTLHSFGGPDGASPFGGLVQGIDGNFYGTTFYGGTDDTCAAGCGTVFKITREGSLTTLHSFSLIDGENPSAGLVQSTDGTLYGTTFQGGINGGGAVFKITPKGTLSTLYNFCLQNDCAGGYYPSAALVQGTDGNFYGTTEYGGASKTCADGCGAIFKINAAGSLSTLHNFDVAGGAYPVGGLVQDTDGSFYGTTKGGGANTCSGIPCGTVFRLTVGLGPFVETKPTSGKAGATILILGNNLKTTIGVSFNGTPATFTASGSAIKTVVPVGATSGTVTVTTPGGTLSSSVVFTVRP